MSSRRDKIQDYISLNKVNPSHTSKYKENLIYFFEPHLNFYQEALSGSNDLPFKTVTDTEYGDTLIHKMDFINESLKYEKGTFYDKQMKGTISVLKEEAIFQNKSDNELHSIIEEDNYTKAKQKLFSTIFKNHINNDF